MHPLDRLCEEFNTSRYEIARDNDGIKQSSLSSLVTRNTTFHEKFDLYIKLATVFEMTPGELIDKLLEYEKK